MKHIPHLGVLFLLVLLSPILPAADAVPEPLWPEGAPGALGTEAKDIPTMMTFLPPAENPAKTAVVIVPGGGYGGVCVEQEGVRSAKWLNSLGIAAFVVDYRQRGRGYGHPAPLQDAQRAIRTVRAKAAELGISPDRIGIMGFSAGGHLASSAGTHFDKGNPDSEDPIERAGCRPDFLILGYPVIAFGEPFTHVGSQHNLLGQDADAALIAKMSSEKQVTAQTPPTFLFTMSEDTVVPAENAISFYMALRKAGVPAELHVYEKGIHGAAVYYDDVTTGVKTWHAQCENWLRDRGLLQ